MRAWRGLKSAVELKLGAPVAVAAPCVGLGVNPSVIVAALRSVAGGRG